MSYTVITPENGYLHLGTQLPAGLQLSIENFVDRQEAQRWCYRLGARAQFAVGDLSLPVRHLLALEVLGPEPTQLPTLTELLAKRERDLGAELNPLSHLHKPASVLQTRTIVTGLARSGLVTATRPEPSLGKGTKDAMLWVVHRTQAGAEFLEALP